MVGVKGQLPEIKAFLKESLGSVKAFLHSVSTTQYTIDGDTARTRTAVYNPTEIDSNGTPSVMVFNLWYHNEFVRTEQGCRISSLREQRSDVRRAGEGWGRTCRDGWSPSN